MDMRRLAFAAVLIVLAACGDEDSAGDTVATVPSVSDPGDASTAPPLSATPLEPVTTSGSAPGFALDPSMPLVVAAVDDLAGRLGIAAADVTVVDARAVTWGDSSLGCPEPGMMYTQQLVDGTLVVLEAGGRRYEYHGGDPLALCENPQPPSGGG